MYAVVRWTYEPCEGAGPSQPFGEAATVVLSFQGQIHPDSAVHYLLLSLPLVIIVGSRQPIIIIIAMLMEIQRLDVGMYWLGLAQDKLAQEVLNVHSESLRYL